MTKLILHNDDDNSSLKIVAALIRYCKHDKIQADQCTLIAHLNGKCQIQSGDFIELLNMKNKLDTLNINVELTQ